MADQINTWFRYGLSERSNRALLLQLDLTYSDLCDAWDAEQGKLAAKRRQKEAALEMLRAAGIRK